MSKCAVKAWSLFKLCHSCQDLVEILPSPLSLSYFTLVETMNCTDFDVVEGQKVIFKLVIESGFPFIQERGGEAECDFSRGELIAHIGLRGGCFLKHGHLHKEIQ